MKILIAISLWVVAGLALPVGCHSPSRSREAPVAAPVRAESTDPLDVEAERTEKTVLEMLWDLEKKVREKDRKIAVLEGKLEDARETIQRLMEGNKPSGSSPTPPR